MLRVIVAIMAMFAFASGALANTETERQCFASEVNACAVESANDGVFLLAQQSYAQCVANCRGYCWALSRGTDPRPRAICTERCIKSRCRSL